MPVCTVTCKKSGWTWAIKIFGLPPSMQKELKTHFPEILFKGSGKSVFLYVGVSQDGGEKEENTHIAEIHSALFKSAYLEELLGVVSNYLNFLDAKKFRVVSMVRDADSHNIIWTWTLQSQF